MATPVSGASAWLTINQKSLSFDPHTENERLIITEYSRNTIRITSKAPEITALLIDEQELETERYGTWIWNPKHYAGLYRFVVQTPHSPPQTALVRVFPHKFSQQLYEQMKKDLSEIALDLHFRLDSPAMEKAEYVERIQDTSPLHDYQQIRGIIEKLRDIMSHLRREPHYALHEQSIQQDWQEISHFSDRVAPLPGGSIILPQSLAERHRIHALPQRWTVQQSHPTYDIYDLNLVQTSGSQKESRRGKGRARASQKQSQRSWVQQRMRRGKQGMKR